MFFVFNYMTGDIVSKHHKLERAQAEFRRRQPKEHSSYAPLNIYEGDPKKITIANIANQWKLLDAERRENCPDPN